MTALPERPPVLIAGAGIGGLTAAIGLQRAGFDVRVFEQADEMREIGAGVSLAPNATRAFRSLGLLDAVRAAGNLPESAEVKHYRSGERMSGYAMGAAMEREWGCPYVQIHRADLQTVLRDAVLGHDGAAIHLGARVEGVTQDQGSVSVQTTRGTFTGGCLIGADGIRSAVRGALFGDDGARYLGYVAWRAVIPAAALPGGAPVPDSAVFIGPGKTLLRYRVRGTSAVNVVAFARHEAWAEEGWSLPADPAELRAAFAGWTGEVEAIVAAMAEAGAYKWGLFGRPALARWHVGRVGLMGDAAHAMLPFLGQGAAMAIEDGVLLARALAQESEIEAGLALFEAYRRPRTDATVARADVQGLKLHGHPIDEATEVPVPREDYVEFGFDAATVPLEPAMPA